ncbi:CpXC domain-containing protein [uncultured Chloroflexus sp.]|uniref:CpXC domain-containing protein n=1 Tax=uncultured Chloroflexus sp. TaxID=214040 RepID=UPI0026228907|nr:CpXC domain-containing protein [uncultured Chloroflexus sp.]
MPSAPPQPVQLACPSCGTRFRSLVYTIVDGGEQPELKAALLTGQLNVAVCPGCGLASMLSAPLIYHDAGKQLFLVYVPQELNSQPKEIEQFVGDASAFLIRALPADAPRGYLLAPRRFLTLQSLIEAIYEADGVSAEDLRRQNRYVEILTELVNLVEDDAQFTEAAQRYTAELTPEFFATLDAFINATNDAQAHMRAMLIKVREKLQAHVARAAALAAAEEVKAAIERLRTVSDDELSAAVHELRPLIDYGFFELWTEQIEAAEAAGDTATAQMLTARRARILELVEEIDRAAQELFERGSALIDAVLSTPDPVAALRERAAEVDEGLLTVISASIAAAHHAGSLELVEQLEKLATAAKDIIESRLSPEDRFINELLAQETTAEATRLLRKNVTKITPDLARRLNERTAEEEKRANQAVAERLRQLAREASALLF